MAYADLSAVQARMPQFTLSVSSRPTQSDAEIFLADAHSQLDATLENMGYVVPITGTKSISIARGMVIALTIVMILQAKAAAVGGDAANSSAERAQKWYDDRINALLDPKNPLELSDAVRTTDMATKPISFVAGLLYDEDGDDIEPHVTMDQQF